MIEWLGKLHPLWVHLPIGILVLAAVLKLMSLTKRWSFLVPALPLILAIAFISSVFTCLSGYLLSLSGGYDGALLGRHQWAGIGLATSCGLAYLLTRKYTSRLLDTSVWTILLGLTTFTGHWGGSLTHGEDFLSIAPQKQKKVAIKDINTALAYQQVIAPILEEKCLACHSTKKQKGKLRLDSREMILKGGEHGPVIMAHVATKSELYKKLLLPETDKEHMPPKGKPQMTEHEIKVLAWWIETGADFEKTVAELKPDAKMLGILKNLENKPKQPNIPNYPVKPVAAADATAIKALKEKGITVVTVAQNSNYLSINFLEKKNVDAETLALLHKIKAQLVWLKIDHTSLVDKDMEAIGRLSNLHELHLNDTEISDAGIKALGALDKLQLLNLAHTQVTGSGLLALQKLKTLQHLYLFGCKLRFDGLSKLKGILPQAKIDTGDFQQLYVLEVNAPKL